MENSEENMDVDIRPQRVKDVGISENPKQWFNAT